MGLQNFTCILSQEYDIIKVMITYYVDSQAIFQKNPLFPLLWHSKLRTGASNLEACVRMGTYIARRFNLDISKDSSIRFC
jgi:hypothetical protein